VELLDSVEWESGTRRIPPVVILREVAASAVAAVLAGIVAGGVGGRLVMRLAALLDPARIGFRTDNGNRIGDITADGTLALVLFGGLFAGMAGATVWVVVRPWLPQRRLARYSAGAVAAVGLSGFTVVDGSNRDFFILEPAVASVVMLLAVVGLAGVLTVWLDQRLVAKWRDARRFTPIALVLLLLGGLFAPTAFAAFVSSDFCFCDVPPRPAGVALFVVAAATGTAWILRWRGIACPPLLWVVGWGATVMAVAFGLAHLVGQVARIV
jgi:hypothetical protein